MYEYSPEYPLSEAQILESLPDFSDDSDTPLFSNFKFDEEKQRTTNDDQVSLLNKGFWEIANKGIVFYQKVEEEKLPSCLEPTNETYQKDKALPQQMSDLNLDLDQKSWSTAPKIKRRGKRSQKFSRWGREEDKYLFGRIYYLERQNLLTLEELLALEANESTVYQTIVSHLASIANWRGLLHHMILRIKKLCNQNEFSVREEKLFRKILKEQISLNKIDYSKIHYEFPGKSFEYIVNCSYKAGKFPKSSKESSYSEKFDFLDTL